MTYRGWYGAATAVVLSVCACSGGEDVEASGPEAAEFAAPEEWALDPDPMFKLPGVEIDGDSIFIHIVMPGTFTSDGDIAVALTQGEYQVLYVDTLGTAIDVFGRTGDGPGEFRRLTHVAANGDTVAAWDWVNGRVSLFADREHVSQFSVPIPRGHVFVGALGSGQVVATPHATQLRTQRFVEGVSPGEPRPYTLHDRAGGRSTTHLGPPDAGSAYMDFPSASDGPGRSYHFGTQCLPETLHITVGDKVLIADGRSGTLTSMDASGELRTLFETGYRGSVRKELIDRVERAIDWADEGRSATAASRNAARERIGRVGDPLPAVWADLVADQNGGVWLQRASCDLSRTAPSTWEVLDPDWTLRATVEVPAELRVLSVREDLVLAAITPDHEIPHLALFRIER